MELISNLYNGLKIKVGKNKFIKLNPAKIEERSIDFYHIYRYSRGVLTSTDIRKYFINRDVGEHFINMNEQLSSVFLRQLLNYGLISIAERSVLVFNN